MHFATESAEATVRRASPLRGKSVIGEREAGMFEPSSSGQHELIDGLDPPSVGRPLHSKDLFIFYRGAVHKFSCGFSIVDIIPNRYNKRTLRR